MAGTLEGQAVVVRESGEASTLMNRGSFGEPLSGGGVRLSWIEAVYLAESGRLEVTDGAAPVGRDDVFRRANASVPGFEVRYLVYRDLRQRGYIVKEAPPPLDFRVYPRGGRPSKTPSTYAVAAVGERSVFDLGDLASEARSVTASRKSLLLGLVDEESDVTYYAVREVVPKGRRALEPKGEAAVAHLLEDRVTILDEETGAALASSGHYGKLVGHRLQLSLLEAVHLLGVGRIEVRRARTNRLISLAALTREARRLQPDFDLRLRVFEDLRASGIVAKTGFKYGSHFRAYESHPDQGHAKYLVHAFPEGHRGLWPEVSRAIRLAHGVRKELLLAAVGREVHYLHIEWVRP